MKSPILNTSRCLWIGLLISFIYYQLNFAITVGSDLTLPFNASIPLSHIWQTLDWSAALRIHENHDFFNSYLTSCAFLVIFPFLKDRFHQAIFLVTLISVLIIENGIVFLAVTAISPLIIFNQLSGLFDREAYSEGAHHWAAVAIWLLVLFSILARLLYRSMRQKLDNHRLHNL